MLWVRLNTISESPVVLNLGTSVDHDQTDSVNCLSCPVGYRTCSRAVIGIEMSRIIGSGFLTTQSLGYVVHTDHYKTFSMG